jgi:hypothetical protein
MSGQFPTSPAPSSVAIASEQTTIVSTTTSGRRQARQIDGQKFKLTARFPIMTRAEFAPIKAFIMKQRSQLNSFTFIPPTIANALGVASTVLNVNGALTAGTTTAQ